MKTLCQSLQLNMRILACLSSLVFAFLVSPLQDAGYKHHGDAMVVFKPTEEMALMQQASPKLRRSRRLSSTRGLIPKNVRELGERDLNQKLGLCPIVSVRDTDKKSLDRGRLSQEWDFNEKISLSSGSSPRIDLRAGFELAKDSARLAELRGEGKNSSRWYVDRTACKDSRIIQENVIKSDSKYEIGVPKEPGKVLGKTKVQRNRESETAGSSSKTMQRSSRGGEKTTGTKSRAKVNKDKIEKANDSISKRLELIHELNQRILANYEKFQQKSKRSHSKSSKDSKEALRGLRRDSEVSGRKATENLSTVSKELIAYSQVATTRQKTADGTRDAEDFQRQKSDTSKFTFSRDYCERLVSKLDKPETNRKKGRAPVPPKKQFSNPKTLRDVNENFSMAPRANFYQPQNLPEVCDSSFKVTRKPHSTMSNYTEKKKPSKDNGSRFCLEEERDQKKMIKVPKVNSVPHTESASKDARQGELHEPKCTIVLAKSENVSSGTLDHFQRISETPDDGETILEKRILDDLNRTISKFDVETDTPQASATESQSSTGKTESFSSDSIESGSSPSTKIKNGSFESNCCVEPFNSSWDSGVGGDVCGGSGWVRVHTGIESSLVYLTLETTAKDVCRDMLLGEDLSLFVQYGGEPGRRLAPSERPLELQDSFLQRLGYLEASRRARLGVDPELRHLVAFHVGPTAPLPELNGYSQCGHVLVLKGLVFPQWKRRPLAVIGSRLFLYPASPDASPEWMELGGNGSAVCCAPSRLGRLVLRVTGYPRITAPRQGSRPRESPHHPETRHLYLGFHHPWDRDLWRGWLKQITLHRDFQCQDEGEFCLLVVKSRPLTLLILYCF